MTLEGDLGGALVPSVHVDTLLAKRTEILEKTAEGLALLLQADQLAGSAGFGSQYLRKTWRKMFWKSLPCSAPGCMAAVRARTRSCLTA